MGLETWVVTISYLKSIILIERHSKINSNLQEKPYTHKAIKLKRKRRTHLSKEKFYHYMIRV